LWVIKWLQYRAARKLQSVFLIKLFWKDKPAAILTDVTQPGDPIVGLHNTIAGGANTLSTAGTGPGQFPGAESPPNAIDNSVDTKYLNFGTTPPGLNTGFYVTPSVGASVVVGLRFATANVEPARDPLAFTLEGTNRDPATATDWALIATASTGLEADPGRKALEAENVEPTFANSAAYTSYRLLITGVRGAGQNSMQFSEVQLLTPEPATMALLLLGGAGVLWRRRRR
jgi:hypothetical protein